MEKKTYFYIASFAFTLISLAIVVFTNFPINGELQAYVLVGLLLAFIGAVFGVYLGIVYSDGGDLVEKRNVDNLSNEESELLNQLVLDANSH